MHLTSRDAGWLLARVKSPEEAETVRRAISSRVAGEAGCAEHVCPFAYRVARARGKGEGGDPTRDEVPPGVGAASDVVEGAVDDGDVGTGEKLLHLLRRWDTKDTVLAVTRINGGFAMAEILGVRRSARPSARSCFLRNSPGGEGAPCMGVLTSER